METRSRNLTIAAEFLGGKTYAEIGDIYNVSRQRVQQITKRFGITRNDGGQHVRKQEDMRRLAELRHWRGDPMAVAFRFWCHVASPDENGCMEWQRSRHKSGYGHTSTWASKDGYAHRAAWRFTHGDIPPKKAILHTCNNRPCCNPEHLYLGTQADVVRKRDALGHNGMRGKLKSSCIHGHPFTESNTYLYKGKRSCRECGRRREHDRRKKQLDSQEQIV
jgi:hypothetical protein